MNFFGFIDETGILSAEKDQPYFGLGLLRLKDTSDLFQKIMFIKAKHRGIFKSKNENQEKEFDIGELKFTNLKTNKYLDMYKEIVEACFEYDHFYFSARVVDKNKKENGKKTDTWKLQIKLSKFHIKEHCKTNNGKKHQIAIIADYLNRPKGKATFESQINKVDNVFNSCMLESNSSVFIQIVDILVGAVVYRYKHPDNNKRIDRSPKMKLVKFIEEKLESKQSTEEKNKDVFKGKLNRKFTIFGNNFYFSVYDK